MQVRWLIGRRPATSRDSQNSPEKRKVGSSTLPLTTITSLAGRLHHLRLACSRDVFAAVSALVPRYAAECRRVRGELVGAAPDPDLWGFRGARRRPSAADLAGHSGTSGP